MNIKLLAAGGLVVAGVAYLILKPKASQKMMSDNGAKSAEVKPSPDNASDIPVTRPTEQKNVPVSAPATNQVQVTEQSAPTPTAEDQTTEEKLTSNLQADSELTKLATIHSVQCAGGKCTIEMEAKEDEANIQMPMFEFIKKHPEYGQNFQFYAREDNPKVTQFTISKD